MCVCVRGCMRACACVCVCRVKNTILRAYIILEGLRMRLCVHFVHRIRLCVHFVHRMRLCVHFVHRIQRDVLTDH